MVGVVLSASRADVPWDFTGGKTVRVELCVDDPEPGAIAKTTGRPTGPGCLTASASSRRSFDPTWISWPPSKTTPSS